QRRVVDAGQAIGRGERVDCKQSFRRAVEARRVIGGGPGGRAGRARAGGWGGGGRGAGSGRGGGRGGAPPGLVAVIGRVRWGGAVRGRQTSRGSISTKLPDSGRSDQRVSAVTWNSTIMPLPRFTAVTSGVPSASVAQVRSARPASGSASTWRLTVTSVGTAMVPNGPSRAQAASGCGWSQLRLPPAIRPPRRVLTGTSTAVEA